MKASTKGLLVGLLIGFVIFVAATGGAIADRLFVIKPLDYLLQQTGERTGISELTQTVLKEESVVINVAEQVSPSVVTVTIETPERRFLEFSPFGGLQPRVEGGQPRDIGTGFIVTEDGLVVTNKHVVSDKEGTYTVVTQDGSVYEVAQISRDPSNDLAILKIESSGFVPVELGDSGNLKVGQFVIAIGTALGEFRHTVTTGVISGLGRGITAGSVFEGFVERLDDVIQTDAAINPGNSGGPLLNSAGQAIGVNVAVAQGAENVGFAIPINIVKTALEQFQKTGNFASKPFLGVQYQMITKNAAILNEVPEGAYVLEVIEGSPAENAGIQSDDIITKLAGVELKEESADLAEVISDQLPGNEITVEIWRDGETLTFTATLSEFSE